MDRVVRGTVMGDKRKSEPPVNTDAAVVAAEGEYSTFSAWEISAIRRFDVESWKRTQSVLRKSSRPLQSFRDNSL
jgi:hypothetical protein